MAESDDRGRDGAAAGSPLAAPIAHGFALPQRETCPFCDNVAGSRPCATLEHRGMALAFLNPRQFTPGAALIIPARHVPTVLELEDEEAVDIMRCVVRVARAVTRAMQPTGLNIFQNNGVVAGQSVSHYHVHVLPRYPDDGWDLGVSSAKCAITPYEERARIAEHIRRHL